MERSPADAVTTRVLQKARRSAERKRTPRLPNMQTLVAAHQNAFYQESKSDISKHLEHIPSFPSCCVQKLICCSLSYCPVRIGDLLRHLPLSIHESVTRISVQTSPLSHCVTSQHTWFGSGLSKYSTNALFENPSLAQLIMAYEFSTLQKKGIKINAAMEQLLDNDRQGWRNSRYNLDFLFYDLDCVCLYLCELLQDWIAPCSPRIKYTRLVPGGKTRGRCLLVRWCSHPIMQSNSTIVEVRLFSEIFQYSKALVRSYAFHLHRSIIPSTQSPQRSSTPPLPQATSPAPCAPWATSAPAASSWPTPLPTPRRRSCRLAAPPRGRSGWTTWLPPSASSVRGLWRAALRRPRPLLSGRLCRCAAPFAEHATPQLRFLPRALLIQGRYRYLASARTTSGCTAPQSSRLSPPRAALTCRDGCPDQAWLTGPGMSGWPGSRWVGARRMSTALLIGKEGAVSWAGCFMSLDVRRQRCGEKEAVPRRRLHRPACSRRSRRARCQSALSTTAARQRKRCT